MDYAKAESQHADEPALSVGPWELWFAWRPVRLYTSGHYAWLRLIHRRRVFKYALETCDFTDEPDAFPNPRMADR